MTGDLAAPSADPSALRSFPRRSLRAGTALYRIHHRRREAFWFGSDDGTGGGGRFDLPPPDGACYTALHVEATTPVPATLLRRMTAWGLRVVPVPDDVPVMPVPPL